MLRNVGPRTRGRHSRVLFLVIVFSSLGQITFTCPRDCFCAPHSKNVQCANKNFLKIPDGIHPETLELNLNENKFQNSGLTRKNFTDFPDLQNLYLSDCGIDTIAVDTFADLKHLSWLDVSKNNIRYLTDSTFRGLQLKHLFINDNLGIQLSLGAFAEMTTQGLYMNNCGLRRLPVDLLTPLSGSLKTLWLHGNSIETFHEKWLHFFKKLAHVRLGGNLLHCNCQILWLHSFYTSSKLSLFAGGESPLCVSPRLVKDKSFDHLTGEDFRCQLPIFQNVDAVFDSKLGKLSCQAGGDPAPNIFWVRPDGTTEKYYRRPDDESESSLGVMVVTDKKLENKEVYKCVASNPAGNVTFSLNIAWPDIRPLQVTTPEPSQLISGSTHNSFQGEGSSLSPNAFYKNYAGDDFQVYGWNEHSERSKMSAVEKPASLGELKVSEKLFSVVDVAGAVIGTFLLTLLATATMFHLFCGQRDRSRDECNYSLSEQANNQRAIPSIYITNEMDDNCIKMINNHHQHNDYIN